MKEDVERKAKPSDPDTEDGPRLDDVLEGIGEGFFALDADWRFTAFNRAAEEIFGLTHDQVIGRVIWEVSPRAVGTEFDRRYRRVMAERTKEEFESYSALRPDRCHSVRAFPLGQGVGVAFRDITDRKRVERAAQESEERLRAIADALPVLISYVDKDQVFRFANKTYEIWFGRPLSEIVGLALRDVMDSAMYEARRSFVERALAGETLSYEAEFPAAVRHRAHRDRARAAPRRSRPRPWHVHDCPGRNSRAKLAGKILAESEERFRAIANSAPVPMWVSRLGGQREFVNRAYHEFLGVSLEEALNFDWRKALHPDDLERILRRATSGRGLPSAVRARGSLPASRRAMALAAFAVSASLGSGRRAHRLYRRGPRRDSVQGG